MPEPAGLEKQMRGAMLIVLVVVIVIAPLVTPHSSFGRWAARHWRDWTLVSLLGSISEAHR